MARKGGRVDLASLATSVGSKSTVDSTARLDGLFRSNVPLTQLVANPRNPRSGLRNLDDLESIKFRQLQPGSVVSRAAWLGLWPEDEQHLEQAKWVVVNGCRRLAAAHKFGREGLDIVIRDGLAVDRETILWAAVVENIDREDFDVLEEAHAVELMVTELGGAGVAAKRLGRSEGWVSQRRALLKLAPKLQESLRAGELALRDARSLATVPRAEQVAAWQAAQEREQQRKGDEGGKPAPAPAEPPSLKAAVRALRRLRTDPASLAAAVRDVFSAEQIEELVSALSRDE
ncbi:peptide transporter [Williamsia muralis]|nr:MULTISPECIES: chromosome partitioning protein [Williamsia]ETD34077.1 chromosome partitioning protein [Williamsia sp. D3]PVY27801.1 ParB family chromosome partitioning protein [Williamsia marianensis]PZT90214.1 MAG: peptide transporter [Gordonia sp. (in: high G+C Gram-positive bacteria)]